MTIAKPRTSLALELPGRVADNPLQRELAIRRDSFGGANAPRLSLSRHSLHALHAPGHESTSSLPTAAARDVVRPSIGRASIGASTE